MLLAAISGTFLGLVLWRFQSPLLRIFHAFNQQLRADTRKLLTLNQLASDEERERTVQAVAISFIQASSKLLGVLIIFALIMGWPLIFTVFSGADWLLQSAIALLTWAVVFHFNKARQKSS